jgi:hypothetical protein
MLGGIAGVTVVSQLAEEIGNYSCPDAYLIFCGSEASENRVDVN